MKSDDGCMKYMLPEEDFEINAVFNLASRPPQ
jgi:hypothetical protein